MLTQFEFEQFPFAILLLSQGIWILKYFWVIEKKWKIIGLLEKKPSFKFTFHGEDNAW